MTFAESLSAKQLESLNARSNLHGSGFESIESKTDMADHTLIASAELKSNIQTALELWVHQQLSLTSATFTLSLMPLGGDAGFRQYFRVLASEQFTPPQQKKQECEAADRALATNTSAVGLRAPQSLLAVYAPPQTEDNQRFCDIAELLRANGVRAPSILAKDIERGFLLLEDFGSVHLADRLQENASLYYGEALLSLVKLQSIPLHLSETIGITSYTEREAKREYDLFQQWFVDEWLKLKLNRDEKNAIEQAFYVLFEAFKKQPQVLVHRDYHSRNIMVSGDESLGIIDFQDALIGPACYDLISLTKDCYVSWPEKMVDNWNLGYAKLACASGLFDDDLLYDNDEASEQAKARAWLEQCDLVGLQRHIKVLGIFTRLAIRDGKQRYLQDLPRVFSYVESMLSRHRGEHAALSALSTLLMAKVKPAFSAAMANVPS